MRNCYKTVSHNVLPRKTNNIRPDGVTGQKHDTNSRAVMIEVSINITKCVETLEKNWSVL